MMSWVKDEWKDGLPSNALIKISELEDECERQAKDKKCLQFQVDTLQASLEKIRAIEEEVKKEKRDAERSLSNCMVDLDDARENLEKVKATSKEKDVTILNLTNEVAKVKKERDAEREKRLQIERETERLLDDLMVKEDELEKATKELKKNNGSTKSDDCDIKGEIDRVGYEQQKLIEENDLLKKERGLEREERWEAEKALQGADKVDIKAQANTLRRRIARKEQETRDLYERIAQLESVMRANNLSEIDFGRSSESSTERLSGSEMADSGREKDSAEFVRKISVMKSHILDLEKENEDLRQTVSDHETRTLSAERISEFANESLRHSVTELDGQLGQAEKARNDMERQLRDERELFMIAENKMKNEIESLKEEIVQCKENWQQEREAFMEQEIHMKERLEQIEKGKTADKCDGASSSSVTNFEAEKQNLTGKITLLAAKVDSLERMKTHLENENAQLLTEIRKEKDYSSDVEETMKEDIDSVRSCLQEKIDKLEEDLEMKVKDSIEMKKESENRQKHVEELYNELDEVNKILADERDKSKKLEQESLEFKKKERVYENALAASAEGDEKVMLSNFVKKRGERWNYDVVELRKRVEELEKKNRELTNAADRKESSVEAIKQGIENKLREGHSRTSSRAFGTPERPSKEVIYSSYSTPVSRNSSSHICESVSNTRSDLGRMLTPKDSLVSQLRVKVQAAQMERDEAIQESNAKIQALEDEIALLKQHVQGVAKSKEGSNAKIAPNTMITPKVFKGDRHGTGNQSVESGSFSKRQDSSAIFGANWNTLEELKGLVAEYENESSELQEIIDESKEAIHELKKALQGNDGLFLVDSANMEEIKKLASLSKSDLDVFDYAGKPSQNVRLYDKQDIPTEKQSYILSRLSLTDIDVESVLSKLRIAISQLESRLERVINDKERVETTIQTMGRDSTVSMSSVSKSFDDISNTRRRRDTGLRTTRSAVIDIARERDAIITDGTIDDIAHEENIRPKEDNIFQHGQRCKLLWQQLCDAKALLSKYDREIAKQRSIYEKQLAEIQEKEQKGSSEEICTQTEERFFKEQLDEKEKKIRRLESQLIEERKSSQVLQEEMENCRVNLDDSKEKNHELAAKLEETRTFLGKHHKSSDKKLDAIISCLQEGLIDQVKSVIEIDQKRKASPSEIRFLRNSGNSHQSSRNTSFYSPEDNKHAEIAAKKSHSRRNRADLHRYKSGSQGYHTIDELEMVKGKMTGIQDHIKGLIACIEQANKEKYKVQEECKHLLQRIEEKDEQIKRAEANLELEKHKMNDNDTEYRAELDALKAEQLAVYQEFRDICETVKRKDVELLNKNKQIKLLTAEWKEKEVNLMTKLDSLQKENKVLWDENSELRVDVERSKNTSEEFTRKMKNSEDNLNQLYQKLSQVDSIFYECKQKGLYK